METALYDPQLGYYATSQNQVGREGDFFTSVSAGSLFGKLLARRFLKWWHENNRPQQWRILELGAHDGKLAADILPAVRTLCPPAWESLQYAIAEPMPRFRQAQSERLQNLAARLLILPSLGGFATVPLPGIAFGNEILDALPFHLVKMTGGKWHQLHVANECSNLTLVPHSIPSESPLTLKLHTLGTCFPEHYQTELRTNFPALLKTISEALAGGLILFTDYGFAAPEYYDIHRTSGTLRTYSKHLAAEDPLARPGEIDITAHVDFTDLALSAMQQGYFPSTFTSQGNYLTRLAKPLILDGSLNDPKSIANFQTLTHPAHLGGKFNAIEFTRSQEIPPSVAHRLALEQDFETPEAIDGQSFRDADPLSLPSLPVHG